MLELIAAPEDVIAVRISGKVGRADLESLVGRFTRSLEERDRTHVFCEVVHLTGVEMAGLVEDMRRALPMLGKLEKLGRIAIVADQRWLRGASRVESALLPHVSYEVYVPEEREHALRWVLGEEPLSRPASG